jgi:chromosomal replication initiation ATPase DnaA
MTIEGCGLGGGLRRGAGNGEREGACRLIEGLVSAALGIGLAELRAEQRGRAAVAFARQTAMYLAHVHFGLSLSEVGRSFGRDRTTVAHACARVEDSRDDPKFERVLACLEAALDRWYQGFATAGSA